MRPLLERRVGAYMLHLTHGLVERPFLAGPKSPSPAGKMLPIPEINKASYLIFPWGTNDPVEAAQRKAARHGLLSMCVDGLCYRHLTTFCQPMTISPCLMVERPLKNWVIIVLLPRVGTHFLALATPPPKKTRLPAVVSSSLGTFSSACE